MPSNNGFRNVVQGLTHSLFRMLIVSAVLSAVVPALTPQACAAEKKPAMIRAEHPRLFITRDNWPQVKARALGPEKEFYAELKKRVDAYPDDIVPETRGMSEADSVAADGSIVVVMRPRPREWGVEAARAAFVYLVEGDPVYLEKAKTMLVVSVKAYRDCIDRGMAVDWYSTSRVHWIAAWDWLYNDLKPADREWLLAGFLLHVDSVRPRPTRPSIYRLNDSDHTTGFYGDRNLSWFTGVAAMGEGVDDALALELLDEGYRYNMDLIEYRRQCAGDDGGLASATTTYAIAHYPWSQVNFLLTWRSATGEDIAPDYPYLAYFPVWIMWNWLPGPYPREFGSGDVYHYDNRLWVENLYTHMSQFMDFFGRSEPECAALAAYIRESVPAEFQQHNWTWFFYPFLLTNIDKAPKPRGPRDTDLKARHFESLGQVFMRSGAGPNDTYCLYTIGSQVPSHKQFDENNFIIYKKGYLAIDTGTRGKSTDYQLRHYYAQTVAHNGVLIDQPGEPFPEYWGLAYDGPEGKISSGGMNKTNGGVVRAFETNDTYTYVCGDATPCYSADKCALALRQFVFVYPDYFIVCDRVISTDASYKKRWLLHTQNEPVITGDTFTAAHESGRIYCQTVYPPKARLEKVGGPGKEFWAAGKNWELDPDVKKMADERYDGALFGNWRVEVSPSSAQKGDIFIHFIQAGDVNLAKPLTASLAEEDGRVGVRFITDNRIVMVTFNRDGDPGGHVVIGSGATLHVDKDLATTVQPQSGLAGGGK